MVSFMSKEEFYKAKAEAEKKVTDGMNLSMKVMGILVLLQYLMMKKQ